MNLLVFLTADYANITGDGKLNVMGVFREINSIIFPARLPSMHLVIKLGAELGEYGTERSLTIKLMDPDGNELINLSGSMQIPPGEGGKRPEVNAIFELKDIIFPTPGPYQFVVLVDRDHKGALPIYVNKIEPPQGNS